MIRGTVLCLVLSLGVAHADEDAARALLERVYGATKLVAISGNGQLTVGVDDRGRLALCRWPSTSFHDQLSYESRNGSVPANHGVYWGFDFKGETIWTNDDRFDTQVDYEGARIIVINGALRDSEIAYRQEVFVDSSRDIVISHIALRGIDVVPRLHYYANFTPCTRKLPELPVADWGTFDGLNDFAAFARDGRIYHLRPVQPGVAHWEYAKELAARDAAVAESAEWTEWTEWTEWAELGVGTYVAYESLESPVDASVLFDSGEPIDRLPKQRAVIGQTAGLLSIVPSRGADGFRATVVTAFGPMLTQVDALLDRARSESYAALRANALEASKWEVPPAIAERASPRLRDLLTRCLAILEVCSDRRSGAIVRSPATQPPLARDWPRHGVWMTHALDLAGRREDATRHIDFYLRALRETSRPSQPAGTLPAALYADGMPAAPHIVLDTDAVGWLLWSLTTHAEFLDEDDRDAFAMRIWDRVEVMGDVVATWTDSLRGVPLPAFDATRFHDRQRRGQLVSMHAGLVAAIHLAELAAQPVPEEWSSAKANADILLQNHFLPEAGSWPEDAPLPVTLTAIPDVSPDAALALVSEALDKRLALLSSATGGEAARLIFEQAIVARKNPERLAKLAEILEDVLVRALRQVDQEGRLSPAFPDALAAAQCYVAASIILGADQADQTVPR